MSITLSFKELNQLPTMLSNGYLAKVDFNILCSYPSTLPIPFTTQATCLGKLLWLSSIIELRHLLSITNLHKDYARFYQM